MSSFVVTDATTLEGEAIDVEIRDGRIDRVVPAGEGDPGAFDPDRRLDAAGRLVTPPLVEPHTHLDAALTAGLAGWNESGTLAESFDLWDDIQGEMTREEVTARARKTVEWFLAHGITRVRSHVGIEELDVVEALVDLREELSDLVDVQLVAFPHAIDRQDWKVDNLERAIELGVDAVGGMPHGEPTREDGVAHVETVADLAARNDLPLDCHIDETDDPGSRFTEVLAVEARERGIADRTTASHLTALSSYPNDYADRLCRLLAETGVSVVTNPLANAVLQGRRDDHPRRRGLTRVEELRDNGVTVGIGQDDVVDTAYAYGDGDPLKAAFVLLHFAHMNGRADVPALWDMLVGANAEVYGAGSEYGLSEGAEGSLVVYDAPSGHEALRTQPPRTLVLRDGDPVARAERSATVGRGDDRRPVEFDHAVER